MARLSNLPSEVIIRVLLHLRLRDILSCCRVNKYFSSLLRNSATLQYQVEAEAAGVTDNPRCRMNVAGRLEKLRRREQNWSKLEPEWREKIPITYNSSTIFELESGHFLLGDAAHFGREVTNAMTHVDLNPSRQRGWSRIDVQKNIIDIGVALDEHDLIALVTLGGANDEPIAFSIDIVLLKFSAGTNHPDALEPRLHVTTASYDAAGYIVAIEIAGDHLALLLQNLNPEIQDHLCVFNWKTGEKIMEEKAIHDTFQGISFLRVDVLLLLNMRLGTLDLYRVQQPRCPGTYQRSYFMKRLALPTLGSTWNLESMSMRAGPRPLLQQPEHSDSENNGHHSNLPFHSSPENTLVLVNLSTISRFPMIRRHFSFVVHRHALLATIVPFVPDIPVPWSTWGSPICRWFNSDVMPMWWPVATHGQRYVRSSGSAVAWPAPVRVLDFNPYNIRKFNLGVASSKFKGTPARKLVKRIKFLGRKLLRQKKPAVSETTQRVVSAANDDGFLSHGVFKENVGGSLPYLECTSRAVFDYDGVLIDEERLVGLKMGEYEGEGRTVDFLHFG